MRRITPDALNALATPDLTHLGLLAEVIADIRRLDASAGEDEAFRSGVRQAITERLPPAPGPPVDWPAGYLLPGSTAADAAGMIGALLEWNDGPATRILAALAGAPVTIAVDRCACRELRGTEAAAFSADPEARCYEREGIMQAGGMSIAIVRLLILQDRIPGEAWEAILCGHPAGEALEPYGMTRDRREATVSRADATVTASATLKLGTRAVGRAEEFITRGFCEHVAGLAG